MKNKVCVKKQEEVNAAVDVYILSGQSNAVGYSFHEGKKLCFPSVKIYNSCNLNRVENAKWNTVKSGQGRDKKRFGPEIGIAEILTKEYENKDGKIALIKSGCGGKAIYDYFLSPSSISSGIGDLGSAKTYRSEKEKITCGEGYYRLLKTVKDGIKKLNKRGFSVNVVGMYWMQGETDGESKAAAEVYEKTLENFFFDVRSFLKNENLPIAVGQIKSPASFEKEIIAVQRKVCDRDENCYLVDTSDLNMQSEDNWHYDTPSMLTLGNRFATALQNKD